MQSIIGWMSNHGDIYLYRYSTWEPEEHILDQRLVQTYDEK